MKPSIDVETILEKVMITVDGDYRTADEQSKFWFSFGEIAQKYFATHGQRRSSIEDGCPPSHEQSVCGLLVQLIGEVRAVREVICTTMDTPGVKRALRLDQKRHLRIARTLRRNVIHSAERRHGPMPPNVYKAVRNRIRKSFWFMEVAKGVSSARRGMELPRDLGGPKSKLQIAYVAWKKRRINRKRKAVSP